MENRRYLETMAANRRARHARVLTHRLKRNVKIRMRKPRQEDPKIAVRAFAALAVVCAIYGIGFVAMQ
ncbi:hypothetical protein ACKTEK_13460 [Tepidamorphus sp. 3E244]|uniref:hypothetical protein n=1 Tax=Tepidamorphus sp. 3E244 TaxID=3385498 RepID=UPI0038FCEA24